MSNIKSSSKIKDEIGDEINKVYNFKQSFQEKCSKYNIKSQPHILPPVRRIIVIGDIHGDWNMTLKSLKIAKLIDKHNHNEWIGGDTVVVQVGDQVDRCRYTGIPCNQESATEHDEGNDWKILQYFTKLHHQAQKVGGAVYSLIGNHELMNVNGDFRYVSYQGLREFDNYKYLDKEGNEHVITDGNQARRWVFAPGNPISEFLACTRQMALIIGSNLFVHAGILPSIAEKYSVQNLNELMSLYLFNTLNDSHLYNDIFISSKDSPLWNRVFGEIGMQKYNKNSEYSDLADPVSKCDNLLKSLKENYGVDKIFVGHTPLLENGIGSACNENIWFADYGASAAFNKFDKANNTPNTQSEDSRTSYRQAQVLEILNGVITILK